MEKKGNTLVEMLVVTALMGIIMGILMPIVYNWQTTESINRLYRLAAYPVLMKAVSQLTSPIPFDSTFCNTVASQMNTIGSINCATSSYPNSPNFTTTNGMSWYGFNGTFNVNQNITVDLNGNVTGPNVIGKDAFQFRVYWDKAVTNEGTHGETGMLLPPQIITNCNNAVVSNLPGAVLSSNSSPNLNSGKYLGYCQTAMYMGWNQNCNQILNAWPGSPSGIYSITPFGANGRESYASCDMTTDSGGWTLILNYLHKGGTIPSTSVFTNKLPITGSSSLGTDESSNLTTWGHISNNTLSNIDFNMTRFYCKTSDHARIINFKTNSCNSYFKTGSGQCNANITTNFTALPGHSANIPAASSNFGSSGGNNSMVYQPFFSWGYYMWNIDFYVDSSDNNRWECDDYSTYPNGGQWSTYHQIWIKGTTSADSIIKNCNNYGGSNCTTAQTNGWNTSCSAIKAAWSSAPNGYYNIGGTMTQCSWY